MEMFDSDDKKDFSLMAELKEGNASAFDEILDRYERRIINLAYRYIGDAQIAEDIAQDVFLKVYAAKDKYRPTGKFSTWIFRITVNRCLNEIRKERKGVMLIASGNQGERGDDAPMNPEGCDERTGESLLLQKEAARVVREAVMSLPEKQRMAVILGKFEGMQYKEIAEVMETTVTSVKLRLNRAKKTLIEKLSGFI